MKIKDGYLLTNVGDSYIVMAVGSTMHLNGLITINETGAFIWNCLKTDTDEASIVRSLCAEFDTDEHTAGEDVHTFVQTLQKAGFLE